MKTRVRHPLSGPDPAPADFAERRWAWCQAVAAAPFLFMATALVAGLWLSVGVPAARGIEATLLFASAALALIVSLARQLPLQNVALAALVLGASGGAAEALSKWSGFPLGAWRPARDSGLLLFGQLPLFMPLIWIVALLSSRGVVRLILRPWRRAPGYGFWLLGLTSLLACCFGTGLEAFATGVKQWWQYDPAAGPRLWHNLPLQTSPGWLVTSGLILCLATPALLNKSPVHRPPDLSPLVVWAALQLLFACGALRHERWSLAAMLLITTFATAGLALRNPRDALPDCGAPSPPG